MMWSRAEFTGLKMSVINMFKFQIRLSIRVFGLATICWFLQSWLISCGEGEKSGVHFQGGETFLEKNVSAFLYVAEASSVSVIAPN